MPAIKIVLSDNIDKLSHARAKLAFIYDSFSQSGDFEFSEFGGLFGLTLILEGLIKEVREIENNLSTLAQDRTHS